MVQKGVLASILLIILMIFYLPVLVLAQMSSSGYTIQTGTTANAGGNTSSVNYLLQTLLGIVSGNIVSTAYKNFVGFFQGANPVLPDVTLNSTDGTNHTNQDLNCFATIEDLDGGSLNVSVNWYKGDVFQFTYDYNNSYASGTFFTSDLSYENTTIGSVWKCSMRLFDGTSYSGWSNSSNLTIVPYSSSLEVFDKELDGESNPKSDDIVYTNEWTVFYANYSSNATNKDLSAYIWNSSNLGNAFTTKEIDLDGDGKKNDFIVGESGDIYAYYSNGTRKWTSNLPSSNVYGVPTIDKEGDGIEEIVVVDYNGFVWVYDIDGTNLFTTSDLGATFYSVAAGDLDDDGFRDDFVVVGNIQPVNSWGLVAFTYDGTNWTNVWNATNPTAGTYEVKLSEIEGEDNLVGTVDYTGGRAYVYNALTGDLIWNVTSDLGTSTTLEFVDLDHDGKRDEVVFGASGNVYYYTETGTQIRQVDQTFSTEWEILVADLDADGWEDDIFVGESYGEAWAFDEDGNTLWRFTEPQEVNQHFDPTTTYAANIKDVDNDGSIDIVFGGVSRTLWILNRTGSVIGRQYVGFETSSDGGDYLGMNADSKGISFLGDVSGDGIEDFVYTRYYGYAYVGQQVLCSIYFNDSSDVEYMIYNVSSGLYEYYRFFNDSDFDKTILDFKSYTWNVTCSKGGYDSQTVNGGDITVYLKNSSLDAYDLEDDSENKAGWLTESVVYEDIETYFFANFTDLAINSSLIEIGFDEHLMEDLGDNVFAVAFADLNRDGVSDELVFTESDDLYGYYSNGTQKWKSTVPSGDVYELAVGDLNNDGFEDEIVVTESGDYIRVFNGTGDQIWNSGDIGDATYSVEVGDLDKDGVEDDFVVGYDYGTSYAIAVYNTSDGVSWQQLWNYTSATYLATVPYEVAIGTINNSNYNYVGAATWDGGRVLVFYSHNGSLVFTPMSDQGYARSLEFVDLDHDGDENEVILGDDGDLFAYDETGTQLWQATEPATYTYEIKKLDLDNDGFEDDVVIADYRYVMGFNETGKRIFFSSPRSPSRIFGSIEIADVNNDGQDEILVGGEEDFVYIFNKSASVIGGYYMVPGNSTIFNRLGSAIGIGSSTGIAVGKSNTTTYLALAGEDVAAYILKVYPNCLIAFNDSVSAQMSYNLSANLYYYSRSFATSGLHLWNVTCEGENHIIRASGPLDVFVTPNSFPGAVDHHINSTLGLNRTAEDLHCFFTISDDDADIMNTTVYWYNTTGSPSLVYSQSFLNQPNGTFIVSTFDSGNTTKHAGTNTWGCNVSVTDGVGFGGNSELRNITIVNTPPMVTNLDPPDENTTYDRSPLFTWDTSDDDGDLINSTLFAIAVQFGGTSACSDQKIATNLTGTSYTFVEDFNCLWDNGYLYEWNVTVSDGESETVSLTNELNIQALLSATLNVSVVDFGSIGQYGSNDTTDNSPLPFVIENDGNAVSNISINSTAFWNTVTSTSKYYQYKIDNVTGEEGAFNWAATMTAWMNVSITGAMVAIAELNYPDATDTAEIDLNITVPPSEAAGKKGATIIFTAELAE